MNFQRSRTPGSGGLLAGGDVHAERPMPGAVLQDAPDHCLVGEAQDVVEVLLSVLRVAARVRAAEGGNRAVDRNRLLSA